MELNQSSDNLDTLRKCIDQTDQMILKSFVTRMRISKEIAEYKKANGLPVRDEEREQEKLDEIRKIAPSDMEESCVMLYNKIMELSRDYQQIIIDKNDQ